MQPQRLSELTRSIKEERSRSGVWHTVAKQFLQRAATTPMTSTSGAVLLPISHNGLLTGLYESAGMQLFAACQRVDFANVYQVVVARVDSMTTPIFAAEGAPHQVVQASFSAPPFGPACKMLCDAVVTNELQTYTAETAATIIAQALTEKFKPTFDSVVFDATAATLGTRPAGLLNGVSDLGATAGGTVSALIGDLGKIAGAMATAGISSEDIFIFTNPIQAIVMRGLLSPLFNRNYTIIGTPAITNKTIVGIAPSAIVTGFLGEPEIEFSSSGLVNMEGATRQGHRHAAQHGGQRQRKKSVASKSDGDTPTGQLRLGAVGDWRGAKN